MSERARIESLFYSLEQQIPGPFRAMIGDKLEGPKQEILLTIERLEEQIRDGANSKPVN